MIFCILLTLTAISSTLQLDDGCLDAYDKCNSISTEYESYKNCIRSRQKRSIDCDTTCNNCNCHSCHYSKCNGSCNSCCSSCCSDYIPCHTRDCCQETCKDQCNNSDCRRKCGRNCNATIKMISAKNDSIVTKNKSIANVTTTISLVNIVNTTNDIHIPIQLTTTNTDNITISGDQFHGNGSAENKCCIVIGPRQCVPTSESPYVRCFHYRSRQCGDLCTATIVHKEERQICQSMYPGITPTCHPKTVYIPQPQPKCRYESTWPYVSCGIKKSASCAGCYADEHAKSYMTCPPECYDTGFGTVPYYRRGPFYRRTYLGNTGLGVYDYDGFDGFQRFSPISGGFFPPPFNGQRFEKFSPDGFEPDVSVNQVNENFDKINVGPNFSNSLDTFRNIRETEVNKNYTRINKPKIRKNEKNKYNDTTAKRQ